MHFSIVAIGLLSALAATVTPPHAQAPWPTKDVRIVAPFPACSPADQIVRMIADPLKATWGQTVIVENVPGAAGSVGVTKVAKSAPDGYTLVMSGDAAIVVNIPRRGLDQAVGDQARLIRGEGRHLERA